jgi:hypothetical protein
MADNAVVAGSVAGLCPMIQIPWISPHTALAFCDALRRVSPPIKRHLLSLSEERRELSWVQPPSVQRNWIS